MRSLLLALATTLLVVGQARAQTTFTVTNSGLSAYRINGINNPGLALVRGKTYTFNITAFGHPFWIKTDPITGDLNSYDDGVSANGVESGTIVWTVPMSAPSTLYYNCEIHAAMTGTFTITSPPVVPAVGPAALVLLALGALGAGALRLSERASSRAG